jgi:UTP:GlnB (protein PII) uridylyltransferase
MIEQLDKILMGNNVVEDFEKFYSVADNKAWLLGIIPEVAACEKREQDNPWHLYNCLGHILHSVQSINSMTGDMDTETRRMLSYTMFLHDIGKPECYLRRFSKMYNREVDSFFGHNEAGAQIANRVLPHLGFDKEATDKIKALVLDHDIFMNITLKNDGNPYHHVLSDELLDEEIGKLSSVGNGVEMMRYLTMVSKADNMAQNPAMTGKALRLLEKIFSMINARESEMAD